MSRSTSRLVAAARQRALGTTKDNMRNSMTRPIRLWTDLYKDMDEGSGVTIGASVATMKLARSRVPSASPRPMPNSIDPNRDPRLERQSSREYSGTTSAQWGSSTTGQQRDGPRLDRDPRHASMLSASADDKNDDTPLRELLSKSSLESSGSPPHKK